MKRIIFLLFTAIITSFIGCTDAPLAHGVSSPSIAVDNQGGIYVLYQVYHSVRYEYYLQKLDSDGSKLWGEKGILVTSRSGSGTSKGQRIFANEYNLITICANNISSISLEGEILWSKTFNDIWQVDYAVGDSAGGVIYITNDLNLKRINAEGDIVWNMPVSPRTYDSVGLKITSDGFGGAVLAIIGKNILEIQRLDTNGGYPWGQEPIQIDSANQEANAYIIADGAGGAFVTLAERDADDTKLHRDLVSILRLAKNGEKLWQKNLSQGLVNFEFIVSDNNGNAFLFWSFSSNLYAQKIAPDGELLWPEARGFEFDGSVYHGAANGKNGVIIGWNLLDQQGRVLRGQIMDEDGVLTIPQDEGIMISNDNRVHSSDLPVSTFKILPDWDGGALFAWGSSEVLYSIEHSSVQRLNSKGEIMWGDSGIQLDDWN